MRLTARPLVATVLAALACGGLAVLSTATGAANATNAAGRLPGCSWSTR